VWLEEAGDLRVLHLDRPPANALDEAMLAELDRLIDVAAADPACRGLLILSDGEMFAAGADIGMLETTPDAPLTFGPRVQQVFNRLEVLPLPVVAALDGHAMGGGLELALACDVRLVSDRPGLKLGLPEVRIGMLAGAGGTQRLTHLVGRTRALDLLMSGRSIDARTALDWGVVTEVLPQEGFEAAARERAQRLAEGATLAIAAVKRCVGHAAYGDLEAGLALERAEAANLMASADGREGLQAFLQHRRPTFTGA
jgi:enoyl-CoA hydratase